MALRKASDSYGLGRPAYNPLWKHIYRSFQEQVNATVSDPHFNDTLYVETRVDDDGVTAHDVIEYAKACDRRPLLIKGPAGIGKTTFLHHVLDPYMKDPHWMIVSIDVESECDVEEPAVAQVRRLVAKKLGGRIKELASDVRRWWRFLLARHEDGYGIAPLALAELEKSSEISSHLLTLMQSFTSEIRARSLDDVRLHLAFARTELRCVPCVIIDNVDQLPASQIKDLVSYACLLAKGPMGDSAPDDAYAGVILALRPVSTVRMCEATQFVTTGELCPPIIAEVLSRRLDCFLKRFKGRVARGTLLSDDGRKAVELRSIFDDEVACQKPDALVEHAIRAMTRVLTQEKSHHGSHMLELVQTLTNDNTRLSLLAGAQFVASGHLDWRGLLDVLAGRRDIKDVLSSRKTFMALILGINAIYDTSSSWLCNLFHDSARDRASVLIRLRVLNAIDASGHESGGADELARDLQELFGYSQERVQGTFDNLQRLGLIEERTPSCMRLTKAGQMYLARMVSDFEYLQHVLVDACVEQEYLVPCTRADESPATRFERVLQFAQWVRRLEVEELAGIMTRQKSGTYNRYFAQGLVCAHIAEPLPRTIEVLRRNDQRTKWDALLVQSEHLRRDCSFAAVETEARELAKEELTRLAREITPLSTADR